jgi:hypothetical protein
MWTARSRICPGSPNGRPSLVELSTSTCLAVQIGRSLSPAERKAASGTHHSTSTTGATVPAYCSFARASGTWQGECRTARSARTGKQADFPNRGEATLARVARCPDRGGASAHTVGCGCLLRRRGRANSVRWCFRPEGGTSRRRATAHALPGIPSTRHAGVRVVALDEEQPWRRPAAAGVRRLVFVRGDHPGSPFLGSRFAGE